MLDVAIEQVMELGFEQMLTVAWDEQAVAAWTAMGFKPIRTLTEWEFENEDPDICLT